MPIPYPIHDFFFGCYAATQQARQVHQERTQVVCSNKEAQKRLNGTPEMDSMIFLLSCTHQFSSVDSHLF